MDYNQGKKVSIIIITWNSAARIKDCLDLIAPVCEFEIIVVDNASTDKTVDLISKNYPNIKIICNSENAGFAKAVNQGIRNSSTPLICLLNDDAILTQEKVRLFQTRFEEDPQLGVLGGQYIYPNGKRQNSIAAQPDLFTELINKRLLNFINSKKYPHKRQTPTQYLDVPSVIGACMWVRREVFEKTSGLDETFFFYLEETDFCLQALRLGYKVKFDPSIEITHLQGASSKKIRTKAKIEYFISLDTYFKKNHNHLQAFLLKLLRSLFLIPKTFLLTVLSIATLFSNNKIRNQCHYYWQILFWHLLRCPKSWGMKP